MAIQFKGSTIANVVPDLTELQEREIGINLATATLYTNDGSQIIEIDASKTNTGLEKNGFGWRLVGTNTSSVLGLNAVELSVGSSSNEGAIGEDSIAIGTSTLAQKANSIAIGTSTSVASNDSVGIGISNSIGSSQTSGAVVVGNNNTTTNTNVSNTNSIIFGNSNTLNGFNSVIVGFNNADVSSSDDNCVAVGISLIGGDNKTIIGKYNATVTNSVFEIGAGTSGGRSTPFAINTDGVAITPNATPANITSGGLNSLVTRGYLADPTTDGVSTVNTQTGVVILTTDNIATANDKLYINQAKLDLIDTNASDISVLSTSKQDTITYTTAGYLMVTNGSANGYEWLENSILNNTDVPSIMGSANQYLKVNSGATALEFATFSSSNVGLDLVENMSPLMLSSDALLPDGTTTNPINNRFTNLENAKVNGGIPATVGYLKATGAIGTSAYQTEWTSVDFSSLGDINPLTGQTGKFLVVDDLITYAVKYVVPSTDDIQDNRGVSQLLTATLDGIDIAIGNADVTNLGYTASPTNGTVTNDKGTNAILPLADATNAGLMSPTEFTKLGFISATSAIDLDLISVTQAVDLDAMEVDIATNATNIATNATNIGTNTTDIDTNATNIGTNTTDIATNATNIGTNTTNIATNTTSIGTLANLTTTNKTDLVVAINEVDADVTTNAGDIITLTNRLSNGNQGLTYVSTTTNHLAQTGEYIFTDTLTTGALTITLPQGNAGGDTIYILDVKGNFATNNVTVGVQTGDSIMGALDGTITLNVNNAETKLVYTGSDWRAI